MGDGLRICLAVRHGAYRGYHRNRRALRETWHGIWGTNFGMFNTVKIVGLLTLLTLILIAAARWFFGQDAVVAVTRGILDIVSERELTGVLAHELGHVRNRDTFVMAVVASVAGAISYMAQMAQWSMWFGGGGRDRRDSGGLGTIGLILGIVLLPLAAMLVQLAVSRSREYGADDQGAELTHDPLALASALRKLETYGKKIPLPVNPSVAPLFIVQPLLPGGLSGLFSTHPPIEERIARLEKMAGAELPAKF